MLWMLPSAMPSSTASSRAGYLCNDNLLRRYRQNPDGLLKAMETLINDLPNGG
ncbi:hypothetical protein Q5H93_19040 [Hymenobacter sp. ASUV-10]|uniref:Uncharacterized protein n=1 Tax=Hymenobacter aranciens TaxID=3063996 RepID=A0ABT9BGM9_9BACT|nr:hypothetical protein [Hymenobacter sp. ASUV-10]MDO7876849.1 hypothetical protein [Hymenobacter sp. ASUV-10]